MLPRKRGAPTLCTVSNPRKLSEEPEVSLSAVTTRRKNTTPQQAWVVWVTASSLISRNESLPFPLVSALWQLKLKAEAGYMVNNPRAIGTRWMREEKFSSDMLVRSPRRQEGIWSKGAHGRVHTVQHNVRSVSHNCNWEMNACITH